MTSIAFIMGVVPPGYFNWRKVLECDIVMGVAVFFGMIGVTFFGLFPLPAFLRSDSYPQQQT